MPTVTEGSGLVVVVWSVTIIFLVISIKSSDVQFGGLRYSSARDDLRGEVG